MQRENGQAPAYDGPALDEIDSPAAVERAIEALFGGVLAAGLVHVTALWADPEGPARTIAVGDEAAPQSDWDAFSLSLCRARADAIVTTGANLRAEPELEHALIAPEPAATALAAWRREQRRREQGPEDRRRDEPPLSVVLTSGRDLDLEHPIFAGRAAIATSADGAERVREAAEERGVEVMTFADPGPHAIVARLRRRGARLVVAELGPSTARQLYRPPTAIDELLLSTYLAPDLPESARAAPLLPDAALEGRLPRLARAVRIEEKSGPWRFERRLRG